MTGSQKTQIGNTPPLTNEVERRNWIIERAAYFTVVKYKDRRYERYESKNLDEARDMARRLPRDEQGKLWMIYAVTDDGRDTFVEALK